MILKALAAIVVLVLLGTWLYYTLRPYGKIVNAALSDSYYYSSNGKGINYSPMGNWFELGNTRFDADVSSFEVIATQFAKDKNHIYYMSYVIDEEVDKNSFRVSDGYARDNQYVYTANYLNEKRKMKIIESADPATFHDLENHEGWSADKNHYFYRLTKVNADVASFKFVTNGFFTDKDWVYYTDWDTVQTSSYASQGFTRLNANYAFNENAVFYNSYFDRNPEKDVDNMSIEVLPKEASVTPKSINDFYIELNGKIYYKGVELNGAAPATFQLLSEFVSKDSVSVFWEMVKIPGADPASFTLMDGLFAKDQTQVFWNGKVLEGADPHSFHITGYASGEDKAYRYTQDGKTKK